MEVNNVDKKINISVVDECVRKLNNVLDCAGYFPLKLNEVLKDTRVSELELAAITKKVTGVQHETEHKNVVQLNRYHQSKANWF